MECQREESCQSSDINMTFICHEAFAAARRLGYFDKPPDADTRTVASTLYPPLFVDPFGRAASLEDAARRINSVAVKHLAGYQWVNKRYKI